MMGMADIPQVERRFLRNPMVAWSELAGSLMVMSPEDSVLHELNETAGFLWRHAEQPVTAAELAQKLASTYEVTPETARADTDAFLDELVQKKLLEIARIEANG